MSGGRGHREPGRDEHEMSFLDRLAEVAQEIGQVGVQRFLDRGQPAFWVSDDSGTYMVRVERVTRAVLQ